MHRTTSDWTIQVNPQAWSVPILVIAAFLAAADLSAAAVRVSGIVRSTRHEPLNASVHLVPYLPNFQSNAHLLDGTGAPNSLLSVRTDASGRYVIAAPAPGIWKIVVREPGYMPMQYFPLSAVAGSRELPPVELPRAETARIQLSTDSGQKLRGASVYATTGTPDLWESHSRDGWRTASRFEKTDEDGQVSFPRLADEALKVTIFKRSGGSFWRIQREAASALRLPEPTGDPSLIEVRGTQGEPIQGALVCAGDLGLPIGLTDEAGRVPLDAEARELPIRVWLNDRRAIVARPALHQNPPVVVVTDAVRVGGQVLDSTGAAMGGVLVWPTHDAGAFTITNSLGYFELVAPVGARFQIQLEAEGHLPKLLRVSDAEVKARRISTANLQRASGLAGLIVDAAGQPVGGSLITVYRKPPSDSRGWYQPDSADGRAASDEHGKFHLEPLHSGQIYEIRVTKPGYVSALRPLGQAALRAPEFRIALLKSQLLQGRLLDSSHNPIAGGKVTFRVADGDPVQEPFEAFAGDDGAFKVDVPLGPLTFDISAQKNGYAPLALRTHSLHDRKAQEPITLVLSRGRTIDGLVVDSRGVPLEGVAVWIHGKSSEGTPFRRTPYRMNRGKPHATTSYAGQFVLRGLSRDRSLRLDFAKDGYLATSHLVLDRATTPVRVVLERGIALQGGIVDDQGSGIERATIRVRPEAREANEPWAQKQPERSTRSGHEGQFLLDGLLPGRYEAEASAPGYQLATVSPVVLTSEDRRDVRFVLERGASLSGLVLTFEGYGVAGARVFVGQTTVVSAADGSYRLDGIKPGRQDIVVSHAEYGRLLEPTDIPPEGTVLDLRFAQGASVRGYVVDETGVPLSAAAVKLTRLDVGKQRSYDAVTGSDGMFQLPHVPIGRYQLRAERIAYRPAALMDPVVVTPEGVPGINIVLHQGFIAGGTVYGLNPEDLARVMITAEDHRAQSRQGISSPQGTYEIAGLDPGTWKIIATLEGGRREASAQVTITGDLQRTNCDLDFGSGFSLTGSVLFAGAPLEGASVTIVSSDGFSQRQTSTDLTGTFRVENLVAGRHTLTVTHSRERIIHNQPAMIVGDTAVRVEIVTVRVSGYVVSGSDAQRVPDALVQFRQVSVASGGGSLFTMGTRQDGSFTFPRLTPGRYRLIVQKKGYGILEEDFDIANEPEQRELRLAISPQ